MNRSNLGARRGNDEAPFNPTARRRYCHFMAGGLTEQVRRLLYAAAPFAGLIASFVLVCAVLVGRFAQ